ncbi:MAG: XdhC family protein, partial [Pseudonocardiaceae bacterium]
LHYGPDGERRGEGMDVFVNSLGPPPRMLVFGAIDFAAAMARIGVFLGYYVTVCDARPIFATKSRFPDAHEVVVEWPHRYLKAEGEAGRIDRRTVVTVLTHDPKFDVPVLVEALGMDLAYLGAMGSRNTHRDREARLREAGVTDEQLSRIASPIGLDLGARTPEETAVSIAAEIISLRWGGGATRLAEREGPIHGANPIAEPEPVDA